MLALQEVTNMDKSMPVDGGHHVLVNELIGKRRRSVLVLHNKFLILKQMSAVYAVGARIVDVVVICVHLPSSHSNQTFDDAVAEISVIIESLSSRTGDRPSCKDVICWVTSIHVSCLGLISVFMSLWWTSQTVLILEGS